MNDYNGMNRPANDDFYMAEETVYDTGYDMEPDSKDIKMTVGEAISGIPGVLALKGGLTDIFKKDEDLTRGISVSRSDDNRVGIKVKVIAETGYSAGSLIQQMTESITDALQSQLGLMTDKVDIDIADTMTATEFYDKYDADRALH